MGKHAQPRITPAFFFLLLTLVDGERHGYAMAREVEERSAGSISLGPGSLYWSLSRLSAAGLIEETRAPEDTTREGRRRYYRLTEQGRDVLEREADPVARPAGAVPAALPARIRRRCPGRDARPPA